MNQFLNYWKLEYNSAVARLIHSASSQYTRVKPGDVLWIVAIREQRLKLLGPIRVSEIVGLRQARRKLGRKDFYAARLHAFAATRDAERRQEIDIHDLAPELRFQSTRRDRLTFVAANRINGKQLQSLRLLTDDSANLLKMRWAETGRSRKVVGAA